jgi:hypothetical protein
MPMEARQASAPEPAVRVWRQEDRFAAAIPELGIVETGPDLATLFMTVEARRAETVGRFTAAGLAYVLAGNGAAPRRGRTGLWIILAVIVMATALAINLIAKAADTAVERLSFVNPVDYSEVIAGRLENVSPERMEALQRNLRVIAEKSAPLAHELRPLVRELCGPEVPPR